MLISSLYFMLYLLPFRICSANWIRRARSSGVRFAVVSSPKRFVASVHAARCACRSVNVSHAIDIAQTPDFNTMIGQNVAGRKGTFGTCLW